MRVSVSITQINLVDGRRREQNICIVDHRFCARIVAVRCASACLCGLDFESSKFKTEIYIVHVQQLTTAQVILVSMVHATIIIELAKTITAIATIIGSLDSAVTLVSYVTLSQYTHRL